MIREATIWGTTVVTGVAMEINAQSDILEGINVAEIAIGSAVEYGIIGIGAVLFYWLWSRSERARDKMTEDRITQLERERDKAQAEARDARAELVRFYNHILNSKDIDPPPPVT